MYKRQIKNANKDPLADFFSTPSIPGQRKYEAIRAIVVDGMNIEAAATKFRYKPSTLYSLLRDAKTGRINLFPVIPRKKKSGKIPASQQHKIVKLRNSGMSAKDISKQLQAKDINVSQRTVERFIFDLGFPKLPRRTNKQLGITRKNTIIPEVAEKIDFDELERFNIDCPVAGVFLFLPYIIESGIIDVIKKCALPGSSIIGSEQACLSMLLLKLIGEERLTHIKQYDREIGFGVFAGLNVLPKATYMNTYSCRCSEEALLKLQEQLIAKFKEWLPELYSSDFINLDFHSIPHFGNESEMEQVWCGSKGKTMKGANTVFAQDTRSNAIMYSRADILRNEESQEVKRFVKYWKKINGTLDETLVFDCKFTTYSVLDELTEDKVKFITLRKRHASLIKKTEAIPEEEWQKKYLPIPKRKRKHVSVFEEVVCLQGCKNTFRQITVKDHGRANPTYIILNNHELSLKDALIVYAKRWHIEQKIAEVVSFFNINALSSPLMIRIHFDIFWTVVADTLYHVLASDLRRFEDCTAPVIFKKFINMPGKVVFDGSNFQIRIRKRAHTPVLLGVDKLKGPISIPWLQGRSLEVVWTA
jgi:transposase